MLNVHLVGKTCGSEQVFGFTSLGPFFRRAFDNYSMFHTISDLTYAFY